MASVTTKAALQRRAYAVSEAEETFARIAARTGNVEAALRAAWPAESQRPLAAVVLRRPGVARLIGELQHHAAVTEDVELVTLVRECLAIATLDPADLFGPDGQLLPIAEMPIDARKAIAGIEVVKRNLDPGDGKSDTVIKVKLWDKPKTIELLAKLTGHFIERREVGAPGAFSDLSDAQLAAALDAARQTIKTTARVIEDDDEPLPEPEEPEP